MNKLIRDTRLEIVRPEHSHRFSDVEVHDIMGGIYARGDRLTQWYLASHMMLALALAGFHQTWAASLLVGLGACGTFALFARLWPRTFFVRAYAGVAQQAFVALHIYQLHGQAEQHFWYFTAFTMMIVYQDWLCMWPGALLIILQHSIFAGLHNAGLPVHFFPEAHVGFVKLFFHFGIALVHVALCGYWAHLLRLQTLGDSWRRLLLDRDRNLLATQLDRLKESEAKLAEQGAALAKVSSQQRAILDNSPDLMWVKGIDGRYVAVNQAFARQVGVPTSEVEGRRPHDFFPSDVLEMILEQDERVIDMRSPSVAEHLVTVSDEQRIMEVSVTPILDTNAELTGTRGVARDITDRRREEFERQRSEARVQHAQKLESLGVLAGGIAHDFNNLLLGILANAELTRDDLPEGSPAHESYGQIVKSAQRAAELTRQMLAYAGKGKFEVRRLDMSIEVEGVLDLLRSAISKKAHLQLDLSPALPEVEADATQIRQVVMNLITNASDALGDVDGVIALRTFAREVRAGDIRTPINQVELADGNYVVVEVRDNGAGMDADTVGRIFDPFFTTKFVGRGLGLSAVLGILRGHRGGVEIESEPGRGSTFRVYLPALADSGNSERVSVAAPARNGKSNGAGLVVVVDDEPSVRRVATTILTRAGYRVMSAVDGVEALQVVDSHSTDVSVVLLDMLMPRLSGEETLRELRRRHPALPVLLNSGYSEQGAAEQLLTEPLVGFVQKPYGVGQLLSAIDEVARRAP